MFETLQNAGTSTPNMCRKDICGECIIPVLEVKPQHRDLYTGDQEKTRENHHPGCVSRSLDGLDTSTKSYPEWASNRGTIADDPNLPNRPHLRVEVQHMLCLPHTGAVLFLVRTYLLSLSDIAQIPLCRERAGRVLAELPEDMAEYKGITRYRKAASDWLLAN